MFMQRTLIVFKPDAVMRGIVGEILSRFERVGLKIVGAKMLQPDYDHYFQHYEGIGTLKSRKGEDIFETQMQEMQQGPVIAMVLEGIEAVETVRKMVGPTEPKSAQPGTIRGDYAHMTYGHASAAERGVPNVLHASADENEAAQEVAHWFSDSELVDYDNTHAHFTMPKPKK
jgi:nucleoside-diphosphate kinase